MFIFLTLISFSIFIYVLFLESRNDKEPNKYTGVFVLLGFIIIGLLATIIEKNDCVKVHDNTFVEDQTD